MKNEDNGTWTEITMETKRMYIFDTHRHVIYNPTAVRVNESGSQTVKDMTGTFHFVESNFNIIEIELA